MRRIITYLMITVGLFALTADVFALAPAAAQSAKINKTGTISISFKDSTSATFAVELSANHFLRIRVRQVSADVELLLAGPDGNELVKINNLEDNQGDEILFWIAQTAGTHRLTVGKSAGPEDSGCELIVEALRPARAQDAILISAQTTVQTAILTFTTAQTADTLMAGLKKMEEALTQWRVAGEQLGEAQTLTFISLIYFNVSEFRASIESGKAALALWQALGDRGAEASMLISIGNAYDNLSETGPAQETLEKARQIALALGNKEIEAFALKGLGSVASNIGQIKRAIDYYQQSLTLFMQTDQPLGVANIYSNIAHCYFTLGQFQQALDNYSMALPIERAASHHSAVASTLCNMGAIYSTLKDNQRARDHFTQALEINRAIGDRRQQAYVLNNLGELELALGETRTALELFEKALPLARESSDRKAIGAILINIGQTHSKLRNFDRALKSYQQALTSSREIGDRSRESEALQNSAQTYYEMGNSAKTLEFANQALAIFQELGNRLGYCVSLQSIARVELGRGQLTEAYEKVVKAIEFLELIRGDLANDQRATFLGVIKEYYDLKIEILMRLHKREPKAGHATSALLASEKARARNLAELLTEAGIDWRQGVDRELNERERALSQQIYQQVEAQLRLISANPSRAAVQAIANELETLTRQYQELQKEIRLKNSTYATLTEPPQLTLPELQSLLDRDTILLEYNLGAARSYLWVVTSSSLEAYELPSQAEILPLARRYKALLFARSQLSRGISVTQPGAADATAQKKAEFERKLQETGSALSKLLLAPIGHLLNRQRLLIVGDTALQNVAFAALPRPPYYSAGESEPLIARHEIVNLPSALTLSILRHSLEGRKPVPQTLAVIADPVFNRQDNRVRGTNGSSAPLTRGLGLQQTSAVSALIDSALAMDIESIPRLPGTRTEASRILSFVPASQRKQAFGFEASRSLIFSEELSKYRILHFATHGFINNTNPEFSGLVLSLIDKKGEPQEGFLLLPDLYNLKLPAELVVLSACVSGLGKEVEGEGLIGLTRGFMYAGAKRVVVSLWNVDDDATAELMVRFYRNMFIGKRSPAAALRAAQASMQREPRWRSPYYWAAFQLQGEYN